MLSPLVAVGGEELSTLSLTRELIRRGNRVVQMASRGPLWDEFEDAGAEMIDTGPYRRSVAAVVAQARLIRTAVVESEVDVVHAQSVLPALAAACALRSVRQRIPLILHVRGVHRPTYVLLGRLFKHAIDCIIANSDYELARLRRHGVDAKRSVRIYNCVNVLPGDGAEDPSALRRELGIPSAAPVIGTVGRLVKEKALPDLLRAFALLLPSCPDAVLLVVGEGALRPRLEAEAMRLGLGARVTFTGARRDLARIYPLIDVFALSSTFESFGNVALEAAFFGRPVVATRVGGLPEAVVDGRTGLLVPPSDPAALSAALLRLLRDPAARTALGTEGRWRVLRHFTPERVADEVEWVYERVGGIARSDRTGGVR